MKDILDKLDKIINEGMLGDMANACEADHEVQMARADLFKIAKYSIKLHDMMKNVSEMQGIEGWQQAKITKAADYLSSVYHNLDYEMSPLNQADAGDTEEVMAQMAYDMAANDDIEEDKVPLPPKRPEQKKAASYSDDHRKSMDDAVHDISLSAEEEDAKKRKNESADLGRETRKFSDWGRK